MIPRIGTVMLLLGMFGCAHNEPALLQYQPVPEGYLQPCDVPELPTDNGAMSEAFVRAAQCAVQGNKDKARIRALFSVPE